MAASLQATIIETSVTIPQAKDDAQKPTMSTEHLTSAVWGTVEDWQQLLLSHSPVLATGKLAKRIALE